MKCPNCGFISPDEALKCECGYIFATHGFYRSFENMRVSEFFFNSWRTFRTNWTTFLILAAIPTLVPSSFALSIGHVIGTVPAFISFIVWILSIMALKITAHNASERKIIGTWEGYYLSLGLFWQYIWTYILYFLIVLGGLFLFIIPGIIWGTRYFFAPYAVIIEGIAGRGALSLSKILTKDRLLKIFALETGFGLLFILTVTIPLNVVILLVGMILGNPFTGFSETTPEWAKALKLFGSIISEGFFVIFNVLLFKSLRALEIYNKTLDKANIASDLNALDEIHRAQD